MPRVSSSEDTRFALIEFYLQAPRLMGGDKSKAREMADEIAKADPAQGYVAELRLARENHDTTSQAALCARALAAAIENYDALVSLATYCELDPPASPTMSEQFARKATQLRADRADAYVVLAHYYGRAVRSADLEPLLAEAEKMVPDDLAPHYAAGNGLLAAGKAFPLAENCFRKYLSGTPEAGRPDLASAHWRLGLVLEKAGRTPEAISEIETAVRMNASLREAKKDLERLR
jgi:tetratricopeptide (TPR) repeat protein